jgi:hypothetical protein
MADKEMMDHYSGMEDDSEAPESKSEKEKGGETALLPKSFFEGKELKPGEQYYVEVVREYEDEVEVKYPHEVKEDKKPTAEADSELEGMATENPGNPGMGGGMGGGY